MIQKHSEHLPDFREFRKTFKLDKTILTGNIFLAPMAGYTDVAFRTICTEFGASLAFTEMASCEALTRNSKKTFDLLVKGSQEKHLGFQLFGSNPKVISDAVKIVTPLKPTVIDLNCGCSVPKVLKTNSGAMLLKDPEKLYRIIKSMKETTPIPVSIKIRSGWDSKSLNFKETGKAAQEAGAAMVTLHPRTRAQGFSGKANWEHIKMLKNELDIPVVGSGDLFEVSDIINMFKHTKCDAVMIARGAIGNPFIFTLSATPPSPIKKLETAMRQLEIAIQYKGEKKACKDMRKHIVAYTKGLPGSAKIRQELIKLETFRQYREVISPYLEYLDSLTEN